MGYYLPRKMLGKWRLIPLSQESAKEKWRRRIRGLRRRWLRTARLTDWENAPDPRTGPWVIEEWVPWEADGKTYAEIAGPDEGDWTVMHFAITNKRLDQAMDIARALQSVRAGGFVYRLRNIETGDIIMADVL